VLQVLLSDSVCESSLLSLERQFSHGIGQIVGSEKTIDHGGPDVGVAHELGESERSWMWRLLFD